MTNQKLMIEMDFCFNTWLAKLIRLSLNTDDLEIYAENVFNKMIYDDISEEQALLLKNFILDYAKLS